MHCFCTRKGLGGWSLVENEVNGRYANWICTRLQIWFLLQIDMIRVPELMEHKASNKNKKQQKRSLTPELQIYSSEWCDKLCNFISSLAYVVPGHLTPKGIEYHYGQTFKQASRCSKRSTNLQVSLNPNVYNLIFFYFLFHYSPKQMSSNPMTSHLISSQLTPITARMVMWPWQMSPHRTTHKHTHTRI